MNKNYGRTALVITALILPLSVLISGLLELRLKSNNSDNVDITNGLAYLSPLIITMVVLFSSLLLISLVCGIFGLKRDQDPKTAKIALLTLVVVSLLSLSSAVVQGRIGKVEDKYRTQIQTTTK